MCGFTGWWDQDPQGQHVLENLTQALAHRGPDASGYYLQGKAALGHRRLAVIDIAASTQPMKSSDGRYVIAYNGELYNFRELRQELESLGCRFLTNGDTEVLLHALITWGKDALTRLQGMFAFALWDAHDETMLIARDHLGVKPLHYVWDGKRLVFASEVKALLEHPSVSREIDPTSIGLFLECQYIPAPYSIYRAIRKLPPAHYLLLRKGVLETACYWQPNYKPKFAFDEETAVAELDRLLRKSVASMLVSDVPLGAFVSGGIDSSLIAALIQKENGQSPQLFHVGFEDEAAKSEHLFAGQVASHLGAELHTLMVTSRHVQEGMEHWIDIFDEPFGDQAALPTLLLAQFSRQHVTVALTGEGADEVFAGYSNYNKRLKQARLCHRLHTYTPLRYIFGLLPSIVRKERIIKTASRPLSKRYTTIPTLLDRELHAGVFSRAFYAEQTEGLESIAEEHYLSCNSDDYLDRMLHIDQKLWMADDLLTKVDRATMAYSLEARVPYLDHELVEFAARLPVHLKLRDGNGKYLLRRLAEKYLPSSIIHRSKQGFVLPLHQWIPGELRPMVDEAFSENGLVRRNIFRPGALQRIRHKGSYRQVNNSRLWSLMLLEHWFRRYAPDYRFD